MSVTGPGRSRTERIEPPTTTAETGTSAGASTTTGATARGSSGQGRHGVVAGLTASGANQAPAAVELPDASGAILPDGTIVARGASAAEGPLAPLNALALGAMPAFEAITDKALLGAVATKLAATHAGLLAKAPDDFTALAWRQGRGATLNLMEQAALRAQALGDKALAKEILGKLTGAIEAETWRPLRDFASESLVSRPEMKATREVKALQESLYPSAPPYEKWLADGKISIFLTCDDSGSKIADNIELYRSMGFKHKANADGSHSLTLAKRGKPPIEITIPPLPKAGEPALFDKMDDPRYDVIAYAGHAGHGQRIEHALAQGVKGSGADKAVILLQCSGHGNIESLERSFPDAQVLSTTEVTSDNEDFLLMGNLIEGFQKKAGWEELAKKTVADLKSEFPDEPGLTHDAHYFFPTTRAVLVERYDRDGDGTPDQGDHIFNVIYPKRVDAAGGFNPVVQPVPKYALDGTALNQAVTQLSLVLRYDHLLPAAEERKLVWNPEKWAPGGFFEPEPGDLSAFRFTKTADGGVAVALSTRFAHTEKHDLGRMLGYESGLWLADEAGKSGTDKTALAVGMLQRVVEGQGAWAGGGGGFVDEPWASEALLRDRYGLSGFTFGQLGALVGEPEDYKPEHFERVRALVRGLPGAAALAEREPTNVGEDLPVRGEMRIASADRSHVIDGAKLAAALRALGIEGEVASASQYGLNENQPTNVLVLVVKDGKTTQVSLGVDSEGVVRAAARLSLDITKKIDVAIYRTIDEMTTRLPAEVAKRARAALSGAYDRERIAGKAIPAALEAAFASLAGKLPPGVHTPEDSDTLYDLEDSGLITRAEWDALRAVVVRAPGIGTSEAYLFEWLWDTTGAGFDAHYERYAREVAAARPGEDPAAARLRGVEAILAAIPAPVGEPEDQSKSTVVQGALALLPLADRPRIEALLRAKMEDPD